MDPKAPDQDQRDQALDPTQSFIIQAPAGSGKTGLLVRRFLKLLATVSHPEQIVAITFTRKATSEMKQRILSALVQASCEQDCEQSVEVTQELMELGKAAAAKDDEEQWDLIKNPSRLRILTIDAFAYELVRHMPWLTRFGAAPIILDDFAAQKLYLEAARRTIEHINLNDQWSHYCIDLLKLTDASYDKAQRLLSGMLGKRDLWMRGLQKPDRALIEGMWQSVIEQQLTRALNAIPSHAKQEIVDLLGFAAAHPYEKKPNADIIVWHEYQTLPAPTLDALPLWRGIAALLLTHSGDIRKRIDVTMGFPSEFQEQKRRLSSLLESLGHHPDFTQLLAQVPSFPEGQFNDQQWTFMEAVVNLLPVAAGELRLLFSEHNVADYIEVTQRAESALGESESPSDLALSLDYQISHLLMDEVQDTSKAQIELVTKLTSGWNPGDGRTLFFVGDPMQSIYGFREAEIGNFLEIKNHGLGNIKLMPLTLQSNFRSSAQLITWVNQVFPEIFPAMDDTTTSAVKYSPSIATQPSQQQAVTIHPMVGADELGEAHRVVEVINDTLSQDPKADVGVLARNRSHLSSIAAALRKHQIPYQAVELESLIHRPVIMDLISLTLALTQLDDRVAWMSILRAPWCGLDLIDLTKLVQSDPDKTIYESGHDDSIMQKLSGPGQQRAARLFSALEKPVQQFGRIPLNDCVFSAWIRLAGPDCISHQDQQDCETYFQLLGKIEADQLPITQASLIDITSRHWSETQTEASVQLMTIHKSKGLEFDTVIVPRLNSRSRPDSRELIRWTRLPEDLLVAVLPHSTDSADKFYQYLGTLKKLRHKNELCRLLYVVSTRARKKLHLFINLKQIQQQQIANPEAGSLWKLLHGPLEQQVSELILQQNPDQVAPQADPAPAQFYRLPENWQAINPVDSITGVHTNLVMDTDQSIDIEFSWAGEIVRVVGVVVHRILQHIDPEQWNQWKTLPTDALVSQYQQQLGTLGLTDTRLEQGLTLLKRAITNLQSDRKADWIFCQDHQHIETEWKLTGMVEKTLVNVIIDRSFVDSEGVRWVVDFKTSHHDEWDKEQFLDNEQQRYGHQLERYAQVLRHIEQRPIGLGLYFPLLQGWREWAAEW